LAQVQEPGSTGIEPRDFRLDGPWSDLTPELTKAPKPRIAMDILFEPAHVAS
jgi:hypothetical protein